MRLCNQCGERYSAPTGKKCRRQRQEADEGSVSLAQILQEVRRVSARVDNVERGNSDRGSVMGSSGTRERLSCQMEGGEQYADPNGMAGVIRSQRQASQQDSEDSLRQHKQMAELMSGTFSNPIGQGQGPPRGGKEGFVAITGLNVIRSRSVDDALAKQWLMEGVGDPVKQVFGGCGTESP